MKDLAEVIRAISYWLAKQDNAERRLMLDLLRERRNILIKLGVRNVL